MFYTVLEIQVMNNGAKSCIPVIYDSYDDALAKLYTVLAAAAKSTIPYHAAVVLNDSGAVTDGKVFDRRGEIE